MNLSASGIDPGQRQLNGPQTTGRTYRNLSQPTHEVVREDDVPATVRDGTDLMVDVYRPSTPGRYPVLIAASPYARQLQNSGAPLGFIEAGQSDFFVPRGYVHVIANLRGTGGSGGTYTFSDSQERRDLYDLVEWAAAQPWSDGNIGMVGISYFAGTQMAAAVEQPPHLKAIMPIAGTYDFYESCTHHGLGSTGFLTPFLAMIGMTSTKGDNVFRSRLVQAASKALRMPAVHKRFEHFNGEAMIAGLKVLLNLPHPSYPWDDLWRAALVEHPYKDAWWDDRDILPLLDRVTIPTYLGCDWGNVSLHLPHTFWALDRLTSSPHVQVAMMGEFGLSWPWESLHVEALAWFDHWLKGQDTGILEGPRVRYILEGDPEWRASDTWPPAQTVHSALRLGADGVMGGEGSEGARRMMTLGTGMNRIRPSETDPPDRLVWNTPPLTHDLDMAGDIELKLDAACSAPDVAWIVCLQDVDATGNVVNVTQGYLRAGLREVDERASRIGAPWLPCRNYDAVPVGERVSYRIPIVPNAYRFKAGHTIRLFLTNDDQDKEKPAIAQFRHDGIGLNCISDIFSSSELLIPALPRQGRGMI
ncbi:CocE/NonD family hydrolase [uncultured Stenotrophomonas sp.]|uniref:CocE/NonD family hydrolase n=1 Tax=uncultured Stenotrophomonas sp. TaxID=165438 RepID=UPI0028E26DFF|nr:CocE/NonD family hydrolase [uncultured Stenotrophomonas sp.]